MSRFAETSPKVVYVESYRGKTFVMATKERYKILDDEGQVQKIEPDTLVIQVGWVNLRDWKDFVTS